MHAWLGGAAKNKTGETVKQKTPPPAATVPKNLVDEQILIDSDEDDRAKPNRKRLQKGDSQASTASSAPAAKSNSSKSPKGNAKKVKIIKETWVDPVVKSNNKNRIKDETEAESPNPAKSQKTTHTSRSSPKSQAPTTEPMFAAPAVRDTSHLCFHGLKFVVTGIFSSAVGGREGVEDMIQANGGKLATAVSGKTNFLVSGETLEDGRPATDGSKNRTAREKKVPILSESQFLAKVVVFEPECVPDIKPVVNKVPYSSSSSSSSNSGCGNSGSSSSSSSSSNKSTLRGLQGGEDLWVERYQPHNTRDMVGGAELVRKLGDWLSKWDKVHNQKVLKIPFNKENPGAKAVLLSGPPGIGKTTVANLIAKEYGFDVLELNASDTRNKSHVQGQLMSAVSSQVINVHDVNKSKQRLVIMDEVDGMGGSDRGGIQELIKVIKISKVPVVCICNDRQSQKIKSLVNSCYDLKVKRPTKQQVAQRLVAIAQKESMQMDPNAAEMLVEQVGNDIRQAINTLQMWKCKSSRINYADMKGGLTTIEKDKVLRQSPFDACGHILGGPKTSLNDRYNEFFIDYSLIPLLVQQNYLESAKSGIFKQPGDDAGKMAKLAAASDAVSDMDLIGGAIFAGMNWQLLPSQAMFSLRVGHHVNGFQGFPSFPQWLGKNSTTTKMGRLTREIVHHTALSVGQGFGPIRLDYIPYMRDLLLRVLFSSATDPNAISNVIAMLDSYGLSREDFMETLKEFQFIIKDNKMFFDRFERIETKTKTALTKAYNAAEHTSQVLVSGPLLKAKGRASAGGEKLMNPEGVVEEEEEAENEKDENGEDDTDISKIVKKKKPAAKKKEASSDGAPKKPTKKAAPKKK